MRRSRRGRWLAIGVLALVFSGAAGAQENLDQGKSGAQLYASDCAICHKSPPNLGSAGGIFGLESFLREHYTASRESAATIAAYLRGMERAAPPASARGRVPKRTAKGEERGRRHESTPTHAAPSAPKSSAAKPDGAKPDEKPAGSKTSDVKPAEPTAAEPKPVEAKAAQAKPARNAKSEKSD